MYQFNTNPVVVKDGKRVKANSNGNYTKVCIYKNECISFAMYGEDKNYCRKHKLGTNYIEKEYKEEIIIHNNQEFRDIRKKNVATGDKAELFIRDLMRTWPEVEYAEKIGEIMGSTDVIYKFKDINYKQSIQVKTLCYNTNKSYTIKYPKKGYSLNTLIVGVTTDFTKFCILFYNEGSPKNITLTFNGRSDNKYKNHMYTDFKAFEISLYYTSREADSDDNKFSESVQKETEMRKRLELKCSEEKLEFKNNDTHASAIDCYINNKRIQCKFTSSKCHFTYQAHITHYGCRINGKSTRVPYKSSDPIDFFIFEISDYPSDFYIIPMFDMIKFGFIQSPSQRGKDTINLAPPDYGKDHWSLPYLNNFSILSD